LVAFGLASWQAALQAAKTVVGGTAAKEATDKIEALKATATTNALFIAERVHELSEREDLKRDRITNHLPFISPRDGFIRVHCPNDVKCRVVTEGGGCTCSGIVDQNQSKILPILKGDTLKMTLREPPDGDVQIYYF